MPYLFDFAQFYRKLDENGVMRPQTDKDSWQNEVLKNSKVEAPAKVKLN